MLESKLEKRAGIILQRLAEAFPRARLELDFDSPLQLLVATILAAQCTDVRVNLVTQTLFRKYREPQDYLEVPEEELQEDIRSTGFYRQKAGKLRQSMNALIERHEGEVPANMEELTALPGVGRKTANVILGNCFGIPGIVVDTHVARLAAIERCQKPVSAGQVIRVVEEKYLSSPTDHRHLTLEIIPFHRRDRGW